MPGTQSMPRGPSARPLLARLFPWLLAGAVGLRLAVGLGLWLWALRHDAQDPLAWLARALLAPDGLVYHGAALKVYQYWTQYYPQGQVGVEHMVSRFAVLLALIYRLTWPHPLTMTVLNALSYLGIGWLARGLARRLGQPAGRAEALALVVCLWPSSLAWSALPMKESPSLLLVMALLSLLTWLPGAGRAPWPRRLLAAAGFVGCAALLCYFRFYFGYLVLAMGATPLLARLLPAASGGPPRPSWRGPAALLGLGVLAFLLTWPWHQEYFVYFAQGELLPRSQFEAASRKLPPPPPAPPAAAPAPAKPQPGPWAEMLGFRQRFQLVAGHSLASDAQGPLSAALLQAPRDLFLFPYPWQRWPATTSWTSINLALSAQGVLWYLLLLGVLPGAWQALRRRPDQALPLLLWGLGLGLLLAFVVLNRGTLFRLRDLALMPLVLFWQPWPWRRGQQKAPTGSGGGWRKGPQT